MLHAGTGMITKMLAAPLRTHDLSKTVELHPELHANDILVADRGFCSYGGWHWQNGLNSCATGSASAFGELTFGRVVGRTIDPDGTAGGDPATTEYFVYDTTSNVLAPLDARVGAFPSALTPAEDYGQIVLRIDATGTPTRRYLWGPGVDRIIADEEVNTGAAEDIVWTLTDHQNSVRDLARYTTATGLTTVEEHIDYDAHGKPLSPSGVDAVIGSTGRLYDEATDLRDHDQRWYDVATARWLSQDPIAFAAGDANLYRYCGNDPVNGVDPSGLAGHHWVPEAVSRDLYALQIITRDAWEYFRRGTYGVMPYDHAGDTWNGVKHLQYNDAVESLIRRFQASVGKPLNEAQARLLLTWIQEGKCSDGAFLKANKDLFKTIWTWRKGYLQSITVAEAAKRASSDLTKKELKAIAKWRVDGVVTEELTGRARKAWGKLGKEVLEKSAKYTVRILIPLALMNAAVKGHAGEGGSGKSGAVGAFLETQRELVAADLVEGLVAPPAKGVIDWFWVYLGLDKGAERMEAKRFDPYYKQ